MAGSDNADRLVDRFAVVIADMTIRETSGAYENDWGVIYG